MDIADNVCKCHFIVINVHSFCQCVKMSIYVIAVDNALVAAAQTGVGVIPRDLEKSPLCAACCHGSCHVDTASVVENLATECSVIAATSWLFLVIMIELTKTMSDVFTSRLDVSEEMWRNDVELERAWSVEMTSDMTSRLPMIPEVPVGAPF